MTFCLPALWGEPKGNPREEDFPEPRLGGAVAVPALEVEGWHRRMRAHLSLTS